MMCDERTLSVKALHVLRVGIQAYRGTSGASGQA